MTVVAQIWKNIPPTFAAAKVVRDALRDLRLHIRNIPAMAM
jgi:hypothetical protein